jgi:hypothetical protein
MDVVSLYADQFPPDDLGRAFAAKYNIPIYKTISEALCRGRDKLAVDAVLSIGEHGDYPLNEKLQREYPRKRFFDEIVAVFKQSRKVVPVFSDKHLSYRWDWAKEMYDTARAMRIPLMAGSSVPLAQRRPPLELPERAKIVEAVSIHGRTISMGWKCCNPWSNRDVEVKREWRMSNFCRATHCGKRRMKASGRRTSRERHLMWNPIQSGFPPRT